MFKWLTDLFLIKEIQSKTGELHFKRWCLFACPWLRIYIHKIYLPDYDAHLHTHPWNFISFILRGGYTQDFIGDSLKRERQSFKVFDLVKMTRYDGHKVLSIDSSPVVTLFFAYGKYSDWGYLTERGYIDHANYRIMKNDGAWK